MSRRQTIDRAMRAVDPPTFTVERFHSRRERKRRNQRASTAVFALVLFGVVVLLVGRSMLLHRNEPVSRTPSPSAVATLRAPGDIAVSTGALIDPADGRETGALAIPAVTDMSWSPDGESIAYAAADGVVVLDTRSGDARQIFPCGIDRHACTVAWSPDGRSIAVARDEVLSLVRVADGETAPVRAFAPNEVVRDPSWSPDGARIAFTVQGPGPSASRDLYTVKPDGSSLTKIVEGTPDAIGVWAPSWSPDGLRIAYIDSDTWGGVPGRGWKLNVTMVDPDGAHPTVLMDAGRCYCLGLIPGLAWAPDGTQLALVIPPPGKDFGDKHSNLYVVNADGTDLHVVAERAVAPLAWRPAGTVSPSSM
jgi:dipeptidyl aminopeptidase/acylaminoacyl peptidase